RRALHRVWDPGFHGQTQYGQNPTVPGFPQLDRPLANGEVIVRLGAERDIPEVLIAYQDDRALHLRLGQERPPSGAELGRRAERDNERMIGCTRAAGFSYEGVLRAYTFEHGSRVDNAVLSMVRRDLDSEHAAQGSGPRSADLRG